MATEQIQVVAERDLDDLLPMVRLYCDFYQVAPSDQDLQELSRNLIDRPSEGLQIIARTKDGQPAGFATIFWSWSTLTAKRFGLMNDLFVLEGHRGNGLADQLILACGELCRERGIDSLCWQTATDNLRAQAVYERVGAVSSRWVDYELKLDSR